ncbi:MAG: PrgI family protein [Patescibacteria group bacterium]
MPQFVVPQFIDVEDKIIGPVTTRQFIILLVDGLVIFILYKALLFLYFAIFGLVLLAFGVVVAFARINGQPFHFFLLNLLQTARKPRMRVWNKGKSDAELRELVGRAPPPPLAPHVRKEPLSKSRLNEIALVVDTGGVYTPEG